MSPELFKVKLVVWIESGNPFFVYELANFKPVFSFHRLYISVNFLILCFVFLSQRETMFCVAGLAKS